MRITSIDAVHKRQQLIYLPVLSRHSLVVATIVVKLRQLEQPKQKQRWSFGHWIVLVSLHFEMNRVVV